jgi:hypothetical protein
MTGENDVPEKIRTELFPNTSLEHSRYISLAGEKRFHLNECSEMKGAAK